MLTPALLAQIMQCPLQRAQRWAEPLNAAMKRFGINTPVRAAYFLAQLGHESLSLSRVEESLSYSRERLLEVFGRYITPAEAAGSWAMRPTPRRRWVIWSTVVVMTRSWVGRPHGCGRS